MLKSTLTAGVLAISLALTSLTPSSATAAISEEDALKGFLTLLAIGAVIHSMNDNDDREARPDRNNRWKTLPAQCQRRLTRRNGNRINFFPQRCLNRNYAHAERLPQRCHVRFRTEAGQQRQGYRTRCLRNEGFRINRR
ncbi:hypothetical protein [Thalassorhabdomicrobium marinisediminis]|uniref:hypothetical protein n=1 Tax=Thalassorhabdomicrobium marinisediminis TaxID=2170577 RepID=UPI00248FE396|nr:hypothetical protein [Thalassorhabdomicrobium marinisediminis]